MAAEVATARALERGLHRIMLFALGDEDEEEDGGRDSASGASTSASTDNYTDSALALSHLDNSVRDSVLQHSSALSTNSNAFSEASASSLLGMSLVP